MATTTLLCTCAAGWELSAKDEVRRPLAEPTARALFMRGNLLVTCADEPAAALEALRAQPTRYLGRVVALQVACEVGKGPEGLETLAQASELLTGIAPGETFRVNCERRGKHAWTSQEAEVAVAEQISSRPGIDVDMRQPDHLVSVEVFQDAAYLGVTRIEEMVRKRILKMQRYAPGMRPLNRAEVKLREAIAQFGLELPREGRALDLGASPGGWTKVLAEHVAEVVAVDPGALDGRVLALPNVRHLAVRSEALGEVPDLGLFDVVVNDMNMPPDKSARVMRDAARWVRRGGIMVMTIKYVSHRRRELVAETVELLEGAYEWLVVRRVPHNSQETTVVGRARGDAGRSR